MERTPQPTTQNPAAKVKAGAVVGTIWTNEDPNRPFHTITLSRFLRIGTATYWYHLSDNDLAQIQQLNTALRNEAAAQLYHRGRNKR